MADLQFDWITLTAEAVDTPASAVPLSGMSKHLILAAAEILEDHDNWRGAGDELTDSEKDEIDAAVALMESEIMMSIELGSMAFQDKDAVDIEGGTILDITALRVLGLIEATEMVIANNQEYNALDTTGTRRQIAKLNGANQWVFGDAAGGVAVLIFAGSGSTVLRLFPDLTALFRGPVGFNNFPALYPTVTGSRGGNAALASLLTALASMGQIINNTTA